MSLEKQIVVERIEVSESGIVQVSAATRILENGEILSSAMNIYAISPGDDYASENARVQAICAAVHTAEVVAAYQAAQSAGT